MIKTSRTFRPKYREDIWVLINNTYFLGKFIGFDDVTHETIVRVNKQVLKFKPQILPYK